MFKMVGLCVAEVEPEECETPDPSDWTDAQKAALINSAIFGAQFLSFGQPSLGFELRAEAAFLDGIEQPWDTLKQQSLQQSEGFLLPAATWFIHSSRRIYEICKEGKLYQGNRWNHWRCKLQQAAAHQALANDTRSIVSRAIFEMDEVEKDTALVCCYYA